MSIEQAGQGNLFLIVDNGFQVRKGIKGVISSDITVGDLNADGVNELVCCVGGDKFVVFDTSLDPMAQVVASGVPIITHDVSARPCLISSGPHEYALFYMDRQHALSWIWSRYKWWLAVIISVISAVGLSLVVRRMTFYRRLVSSVHSLAGIAGLEKVSSMVVVMNRRGEIIFTNSTPLARLLLGEKVKRKQHYAHSGLGKYPAIVQFINRAYSDPHSFFEGQYMVDNNGNQIVASLAIYPRFDENNVFRGKILIGEDVTGKVRSERKAGLGDAAQLWIHQFKNVIGSIQTIIGNIADNTAIPREVRSNEILKRSLDQINKQSEQARLASEKILRFSHLPKPELVPCGINNIIDMVLDRPTIAVQGNVTVAKIQQRDLPRILLDPEQVSEALENLISNAIASVGSEGKITRISRLAQYLHDGSNRRAIEVVISDDGCGIPEEALTRIFEPGYTTKVGGTGIGLAFVKEIVENHNGWVTVESTVGRGSTFTLSFCVS